MEKGIYSELQGRLGMKFKGKLGKRNCYMVINERSGFFFESLHLYDKNLIYCIHEIELVRYKLLK